MTSSSQTPISASQAQSVDSASAASRHANEQDLRTQLRHFVIEWTDELGAEWRYERAVALHETLEQLAASADQIGLSILAEPAITLIVYMCSFLEAAAYPSPAQQQHMHDLVRQLALALEEKPLQQTAAIQPIDQQIVFYLRDAAHDMPGLAAQLTQRHYTVQLFDALDVAVAAISETEPDVLIVEDTFVPQLHTLMDAVERRRDAHAPAVACVVLAQNADLTRTLFALRAGADAVTAQNDPAALAASIDAQLAQRRSQGFRVLVVEDDRSQAQFCESILRHRGMTTRLCTHGHEVLNAVAEFKPDLVLLDLYLSDSNGIEISQRIRERPEWALLPVVFLSGEQDLDLRFDAIRMGGDDFVTKPIKPRHLLLMVESRVRRARALGSGVSTSGERRGVLISRETFAQEVMRMARGDTGQQLALAMIAVDAEESLEERLGFVAIGALSQQVAVVLSSELHHGRWLCAYGPLRFLAVLQGNDELALQKETESVRQKLHSRLWLSAEHPAQLQFTITGKRLASEIVNIDKLVGRIACQNYIAQAGGGARTELDLQTFADPGTSDPQTQAIKSILRGPIAGDAMHLSFQPRISLVAQEAAHYVVRMALALPKSPEALVDVGGYREIARELCLTPRVDRALLHQALRRLNTSLAARGELHLTLPLSLQSLVDPAFAPWLVTELRSLYLPATAITLELDAEEIREYRDKLQVALDALQRVGVQFSLILTRADPANRQLMQFGFQLVGIRRPESGSLTDPWETLSDVFGEAASLGRRLLALDVLNQQELDGLRRSGVHYAQGDFLCPWLRQMDFDFSRTDFSHTEK